jgi:hypothetical protein
MYPVHHYSAALSLVRRFSVALTLYAYTALRYPCAPIQRCVNSVRLYSAALSLCADSALR